MARKELVTGSMILDTAFAMSREEGFANVTARKVAAHVGCSTQPIFRVYKNMDELWKAVIERASEYFQEYYSRYPKQSEVPFANLGMAYIAFAREEKNLFELLFVSSGENRKSMYELLNGSQGNVVHEINLARSGGCANPGELFMRMWILIHGAACMCLTGDYDLSEGETLKLLESSYGAFIGIKE